MSSNIIKVQQEDFDISGLNALIRDDSGSHGAIVTFTGIVREMASGPGLLAMELEHYPGMTEKSLEKIATQARERWELGAIVIVHRVGKLSLNDNIVFVGVASPHRVAGFAAAQFIMDYLKRDAPFWKKEITEHGESWVAAKDTDLKRADSWDE
ncbi:molybdenum cofactor biosynthesis protein MoaE [Aliamphritea ceti]|uniref:molybdenum cofactor biosynthesis protein MoaE n=1 Tax=Aliamphritea ceti TaxID=1524258 RepID=UPI0021C360F1|nr:molybdenum cofactor biosynthesis protein MoaE [Aliamphritea ceti]